MLQMDIYVNVWYVTNVTFSRVSTNQWTWRKILTTLRHSTTWDHPALSNTPFSFRSGHSFSFPFCEKFYSCPPAPAPAFPAPWAQRCSTPSWSSQVTGHHVSQIAHFGQMPDKTTCSILKIFTTWTGAMVLHPAGPRPELTHSLTRSLTRAFGVRLSETWLHGEAWRARTKWTRPLSAVSTRQLSRERYCVVSRCDKRHCKDISWFHCKNISWLRTASANYLTNSVRRCCFSRRQNCLDRRCKRRNRTRRTQTCQ